MKGSLNLLPDSASSMASRVDMLFFSLLGLSVLVILGVVVTATVFSFRYRRGSRANRIKLSVSESSKTQSRIELTWISITLALFLITFFWGAKLYSRLLTPPANAIEINLVAKQWVWTLQHPEGKREINELHVPRGVPVKLVMTSEDVIHSFYVPAFRIKQDVLPGRYLRTWFTATQTGKFRFLCAEYCGTNHSKMGGEVVVMEPESYKKWLHSGPAKGNLAEQGRKKFQQFGCSACHDPGSGVHAPRLKGLYGRRVLLQGGTSIIANDSYIRESILKPRKQIVRGYAPIMPSFDGQVSEEDIMQIIAYIKSLSKEKPNEHNR
jgi:cytochrome c oxidase subunit 2